MNTSGPISKLDTMTVTTLFTLKGLTLFQGKEGI